MRRVNPLNRLNAFEFLPAGCAQANEFLSASQFLVLRFQLDIKADICGLRLDEVAVEELRQRRGRASRSARDRPQPALQKRAGGLHLAFPARLPYQPVNVVVAV